MGQDQEHLAEGSGPTCKITLPSTVAWDGYSAALELVKKEVCDDEGYNLISSSGVATGDESGRVRE